MRHLLLLLVLFGAQSSLGIDDLACRQYSDWYKSTQKAVEAIKADAGGITRSAVQGAIDECNGKKSNCAHLVVHKGQLYVAKYYTGFQTRLESMLLLLAHAVFLAHEKLPDSEFVLTSDDYPYLQPGTWNLFRRKDSRKSFLFPPFIMYQWPEASLPPWRAILLDVGKHDSSRPLGSKIPKAFFSGNFHTSKWRKDLVDLYGNRPDVVELVNTPHYPSKEFKTPAEFCGYQYLLSIDGQTASSRVTSLALCNSVIITHDSPWEDAVSSMLGEIEGPGGLNSVGSDWKNLESVIANLQKDSAAVETSVQKRALWMRHVLRPRGALCHIREMLLRTGELMAYNVTLEGVNPILPAELFFLQQLKKSWSVDS